MDLLNLIESDASDCDGNSDNDSLDGPKAPHQQDDVPEPSKKKQKQGMVDVIPSRQASPNLFVRTVPHKRGRWSGHVFCPFPHVNDDANIVQSSVTKFQNRLERAGFSGIMVQHEELHFSLSRHLSFQIGSIESFMKQLATRVSAERSTRLLVDTTGVLLVNDEKTRSFYGWRVCPNPTIHRMLRHVDEVLKNYNQPAYYDPPIFHISLASVTGDISKLWQESEDMDDNDEEDQDGTTFTSVQKICCTFGTTKKYTIDLLPSA
jgi:hypothetical protein